MNNKIDPVAAYEYVRRYAIRTPMRRLKWLESVVGVPVWAKLENQQHTGSFKYRGAVYRLRDARPGQTCIAASAGNHGLAVAQVAATRGARANVCVPVNASPLKKRRILEMGSGVIEYGASLQEACAHAQLLAAQHGGEYISPYNDPAVISGQSTVATEMLEEVPEITAFVVPIGGGGLAAGMATACRLLSTSIRIFGCEPCQYASMSDALAGATQEDILNQPTLADGLAVAPELGALTTELIRKLVCTIVTLSEEDLAASTLLLLHRESLLVEPAGAAAVAALLKLSSAGYINGAVGLPLCGGNLHVAQLERIQRYPLSSDLYIRLLERRGRTVHEYPTAQVFSVGGTIPQVTNAGSWREDLLYHIGRCSRRLLEAANQIRHFVQYCKLHDLEAPSEASAILLQHSAAAYELLRATEDDLRNTGDYEVARLLRAEATLRVALQANAHTRTSLEWRSPAYAQSRIAQFMSLSNQDSPEVNYERYRTSESKRIEEQLSYAMGLPRDQYAVTVTSSGMSAFCLIMNYLLKTCADNDRPVLVSPYVYFEANEQLAGMSLGRIVRASEYSLNNLTLLAAQTQPRVVFADPLANNGEQRMIDIRELIHRLSEVVIHPTTLVVDGTMLPFACGPAIYSPVANVEVLYYESCSKFLQFGLDLCMAGFVVHSISASQTFDRIRRNTGAMLYEGAACAFPDCDAEHIWKRSGRLEANASWLAAKLNDDDAITRCARIVYPGLDTHPEHKLSGAIGRAGSCITFIFHERGHERREFMDSIIQNILYHAGKNRVVMSKGVSFGFSAPRISAASSMAEDSLPFLRLSVGDLGPSQLSGLAEAIGAGFGRMSQ